MWNFPIINEYTALKILLYQLGTYQQITFLELKNYTAEDYKEALRKVYFIQNLMIVINKLAPCKTKRVKGNSKDWFDGEVLENTA